MFAIVIELQIANLEYNHFRILHAIINPFGRNENVLSACKQWKNDEGDNLERFHRIGFRKDNGSNWSSDYDCRRT